MTQDTREGERRLSALRKVSAIFIGSPNTLPRILCVADRYEDFPMAGTSPPRLPIRSRGWASSIVMRRITAVPRAAAENFQLFSQPKLRYCRKRRRGRSQIVAGTPLTPAVISVEVDDLDEVLRRFMLPAAGSEARRASPDRCVGFTSATNRAARLRYCRRIRDHPLVLC